ncbi:hypothetical protein PF003_g21140 [Phytophthora fragariae]|nr:hypothetical protein PF003_g21140 [Phytophthora fragariae]
MAFLATEDRFGPDLNRYRQGEPNPCTYIPENDGVLLPGGENASGTFGYHRSEQHEKPSHFVNAACSSPAIAATLKALEENSLQRMRETSVPTPCTYVPTVDGQFRRVYTLKEILAERKRTAIQRKLVKNEDAMTAQELHLALGPGSYEVSQDTNQEKIATPFSFSHEKRHGILDNAAARVHSDSQLHQQQKNDAAMYSKELAKSYQELGASVQRLGNRLASPEFREKTFQRFDKDVNAVEAFRRGPGSYECTSFPRFNGDSLKNNEGASTRVDCFQLSPLPSVKPSTSFGYVASRDLLTSMIAAGHASAHTIGPGVYDAHPSSFIVPTHNLGYKQEMKRLEAKSRLQSTSTSRSRSADSDANGDTQDDTRRLSRKEMWNVMKQGPTLPSQL